MHLLGDPPTTRPFQTCVVCTIEPYPIWRFPITENEDCQVGQCSVWTRTQTRSDGPAPFRTFYLLPYLESGPFTWCVCPLHIHKQILMSHNRVAEVKKKLTQSKIGTQLVFHSNMLPKIQFCLLFPHDAGAVNMYLSKSDIHTVIPWGGYMQR